MFIGHHAPAVAIKATSPNVPLWHFFVAVQFLDYLWSAFILTGVEHARIVPGFLAASNLDLYHMPYTHSLVAAIGWSVFAAIIYPALINKKAGIAGGAAIGAAVASHWLTDLIVHAPDLALFPGSDQMFGFSLWSSLPLSQGLEIALLAAGFLLYLGATQPRGAIGRLSPFVVLAAMIGIQFFALLGEMPDNIQLFAVTALVSYTLLAALAFWLDQTREPRRSGRIYS